MTVLELHSLVESISFVGGLKAWGACVEARRDDRSDAVDVVLRYTVPDRDTGEPIGIHAVTSFDERFLLSMTAAQVIGMLHRELRATFLHELNESFLIAGRHVVEPHPEDKRNRGAA